MPVMSEEDLRRVSGDTRATFEAHAGRCALCDQDGADERCPDGWRLEGIVALWRSRLVSLMGRFPRNGEMAAIRKRYGLPGGV